MKFLKRISILVSLAFVCIMTQAADYELHAADINIYKGDLATLAIEMNNANDVVGFQCDILLPNEVEISGDISLHRHVNGIHTLVKKEQANGAMRVMVYSNPNTAFTGNSGVVLSIPLEVKSPVGTYSIKLQNAVISAPNAVPHYVEDSEVALIVKPEYVKVEGLSLNKTALDLNIGDSEQLIATVSPDNASEKDITWTSSDGNVASVDANGLITAISAGSATITASCGAFSATCEIKVHIVEAASVTLNKTALDLKIGDSEQLIASVSPENTTDKTITWTSSDGNVASVDANGLITAISVGSATITASCGNASATCAVTVLPIQATSVTLNKTALDITLGSSEQLIASVSPENTTDKTITWISSDDNVASVDANGLITAISVGAATITATCGNASATCAVTVLPIQATSVTLNKTALDLKIGDSEQLIASVSPENTTDKTITWISSDGNIASVDANGLITAISAGSATITASCGNASATCEINISKKDQTIIWEQSFDSVKTDSIIELTAVASSGLEVVYTVIMGDASIQGNILKVHSAGLVQVEASQPGNNEFNAAPAVVKDIQVITSINSVYMDKDVKYFDLMGRPVDNPHDGIFIMIENNKSSKVIF